MAKSSVELQLKELKDMVSTLNQTIAVLNATMVTMRMFILIT